MTTAFEAYSSGAGLEIWFVAAMIGEDQPSSPQFILDFGEYAPAGYGVFFQDATVRAYAAGRAWHCTPKMGP